MVHMYNWGLYLPSGLFSYCIGLLQLWLELIEFVIEI
jgi:hypothetical protein